MRVIKGLALGTYYAKGATARGVDAELVADAGLALRGEGQPGEAEPTPGDRASPASLVGARPRRPDQCHRAGAGLGEVRVLAAQAAPLLAKHDGHDNSTAALVANLRRTSAAVPLTGIIVMVDDNVHRGRSIIALDRFLGATGRVAAFAVAITDSQPREDAYTPRKFEISYDPDDATLAGHIDAP